MPFTKDVTITLTPDSVGDSAKMSARPGGIISCEYVLSDTEGRRYQTSPENFNVFDAPMTTPTEDAIKAWLLSEFSVSATTEQAAEIRLLAFQGVIVDVRAYAAGLAGFSYTP